jgi:hypothetical protein
MIVILLTALSYAVWGQNSAIMEGGKAVLSQVEAEWDRFRATWASEDSNRAAQIAEQRRVEAENQRRSLMSKKQRLKNREMLQWSNRNKLRRG